MGRCFIVNGREEAEIRKVKQTWCCGGKECFIWSNRAPCFGGVFVKFLQLNACVIDSRARLGIYKKNRRSRRSVWFHIKNRNKKWHRRMKKSWWRRSHTLWTSLKNSRPRWLRLLLLHIPQSCRNLSSMKLNR